MVFLTGEFLENINFCQSNPFVAEVEIVYILYSGFSIQACVAILIHMLLFVYQISPDSGGGLI